MKSWLKKVRADRVVVYTTDGQTLRGVLLATYRRELVLSHVELLTPSGPEPLVGDVGVPRERVSFVQWTGGVQE